MKVKILRGTVIAGMQVMPGEEHDLSDVDARFLIKSGKAELVDKGDKENAEAEANVVFARNPNDLMGNDDPRVSPTVINKIDPVSTPANADPEKFGKVGETAWSENDSTQKAQTPKKGLTTDSFKPVERTEKR